jgi:phosphatidylserine/phosphatidylglycerophosphate/cardiolipin synthase-like enzyme
MKILFITFILSVLFLSTSAQEILLLNQTNQNSLEFNWQTTKTIECFIEYGQTPALELGTQKGLTLENLSPATIYYVRAYTDREGVKQYSETGIFSTASKSSGDIRVYFNHWCDNDASAIADAVWTEYLEDTIVSYVNSAQNTLDVCNYSTGSLPIVTAINNAESRGVIVRYIAAANTGTNNDELDNLSGTIPFIQRPDDGEVMHNKFLIIDLADSDKATILTGSTNHTYNSCHDDYNNMVIIQDQALANAYKTEFEEMWGSNTNTPNPANAKFGADKIDNTPHNFNIGGVSVELYFSPSDGTTSHIVDAVSSANTDMQFAMLTFINNDLGDAVIGIHDAGVDVKGIIENILYFGSEYNSLVDAGVDVLSHFSTANFFHHKYGVVDATNTSSDPLVITGSHNWTNSAEDDYDENTLIIHNAEIAGMYHEEFMARYAEMTGAGINTSEFDQNIELFPNPTNEVFIVKSSVKPESLNIFDSCGRLVFCDNNPSIEMSVNTLSFPDGIYLISIIFQNSITNTRIVVTH